MLKNYKNVESADNIVGKHTLDSLNPRIPGPSSPTKLEKNHKYFARMTGKLEI
jgi:hypothetical protein